MVTCAEGVLVAVGALRNSSDRLSARVTPTWLSFCSEGSVSRVRKSQAAEQAPLDGQTVKARLRLSLCSA